MKSILRYLSIVSISAVLFSACNFGVSDEQAKETVKEAMKNTQNVKSGEYDYLISADVIDSEAGGSFELSIEGAFDIRDFKNLMFSMAFDGSLDDPTLGEQKVKAEMRILENTGYAMLSSAPDMAALLDPEFESKYIGKWFSMPIPQELFDEIEKYDSLSDADYAGEMTPEEQEIRDMILSVNYVASAKSEGSENGMDKYSIALDADAIVELMEKISLVDGGYQPTDEEKQSLKDTINSLSQGLNIWIDPSANVVTRFVGQFEVPMNEAAAAEDAVGKVVINLDLGMSNLNGDIKLEAPEGAEAFDFAALLGLQGASEPVVEE